MLVVNSSFILFYMILGFVIKNNITIIKNEQKFKFIVGMNDNLPGFLISNRNINLQLYSYSLEKKYRQWMPK